MNNEAAIVVQAYANFFLNVRISQWFLIALKVRFQFALLSCRVLKKQTFNKIAEKCKKLSPKMLENQNGFLL